MRFAALSLLSLAALVAAQNQTVTVQVGGDADSPGGFFQFNPNTITASEGSVITFEFSGNPGNHSITQSSFANPCEPLSGGFDSGWVFIPQGQTDDIPTWNLTITNGSTPLWFFCKQLVPQPHCKSGMVGAINAPTSGNTFSAFQQAAASSSGNPGQGEGGLVGVGASASAAPGPLTGSVMGFANPTGASAPSASAGASGSSSSGSAAKPSSTANTTSGASSIAVDLFLALLASLAGFALA